MAGPQHGYAPGLLLHLGQRRLASALHARFGWTSRLNLLARDGDRSG